MERVSWRRRRRSKSPEQLASVYRRRVPNAARRQPRYGSFLFSGTLAGLITSVVVLQVFGGGGGQDQTELTILLTVMLMGLGALLAGALAVFLEGRKSSSRRARGDAGESPRSP